MSKNKKARNALKRLFGKVCMMEEWGIRKIPKEERQKSPDYRKAEDDITYHHLQRVSEGGSATIENGANLKTYNHEYLEGLTRDEREEINDELRRKKLEVAGVPSTRALTQEEIDAFKKASPEEKEKLREKYKTFLVGEESASERFREELKVSFPRDPRNKEGSKTEENKSKKGQNTSTRSSNPNAKRKTRAQEKQELQDLINEYYDGLEEDDDWNR